MRLQEIVPDNVTLEELEDLQTQLHQLLVQKYGAGAAAAVRQKDRVFTAVPNQNQQNHHHQVVILCVFSSAIYEQTTLNRVQPGSFMGLPGHLVNLPCDLLYCTWYSSDMQ